MRIQFALVLLLVLGASCENSDEECLKSFLESSEALKCDSEPFNLIKRNFESIFEEIYESLPVNSTCIKKKTTQDEMNLAYSLLLVSNDEDARKTLRNSQQLLMLILNKILICYDHDAFIKNRIKIYENLKDERMKNCISLLATHENLDKECETIVAKISEILEIDEIFFKNSIFTGANLNHHYYDKCTNMKYDELENLREALRAIFDVERNGKKLKNRDRFQLFYLTFIKDMVKCLQNDQNLSPTPSQQGNDINNQGVSEVSHLILLMLKFVIIFLTVLSVLIVYSGVDRKEKFRYVIID